MFAEFLTSFTSLVKKANYYTYMIFSVNLAIYHIFKVTIQSISFTEFNKFLRSKIHQIIPTSSSRVSFAGNLPREA